MLRGRRAGRGWPSSSRSARAKVSLQNDKNHDNHEVHHSAEWRWSRDAGALRSPGPAARRLSLGPRQVGADDPRHRRALGILQRQVIERLAAPVARHEWVPRSSGSRRQPVASSRWQTVGSRRCPESAEPDDRAVSLSLRRPPAARSDHCTRARCPVRRRRWSRRRALPDPRKVRARSARRSRGVAPRWDRRGATR